MGEKKTKSTFSSSGTLSLALSWSLSWSLVFCFSHHSSSLIEQRGAMKRLKRKAAAGSERKRRR